MRSPTLSAAAKVLRLLAATAVALSWSLVAALPAPAEVMGWGVQSPSEGAVLDRPTELVVYVDRTASTEEEQVEVRTRLLGPSGEPVSDKVINLKLKRTERTDTGDQMFFGGTIDPYQLEWLAEPGVVANGQHTLQLQVREVTGDMEQPTETTQWNDHAIAFDAPPPPAGQPQVEVADRAAKRLRVAWAPSTAPDLLNYAVERRVDGGPWRMAQDLVAPDVTQITDTVAAYGSYRYRVTAVRPAGDGSGEYRAVQSDPSWTTELAAPRKPARRGNTRGNEVVDPAPARPRVQAPPPRPLAPRFRAPVDANQTYEGPLDYGVKPTKVTERVPIEIARGGTSEDRSVLRVLRSVDQQRVLPAVAGGLIFLLSAAHVVRYLNE